MLLVIRAEAEFDALTRPRAHVFTIHNKPAAGDDTLLFQYYVSNESPIRWTDGNGEPLNGQIAVTIGPEVLHGRLRPLSGYRLR